MAPIEAHMDVVGFTLIVDDIVMPDGRTCMAQLGGGGPQTLFGYQLATSQTSSVGLAAGVGADLPANCQAWLARIGCDLSGLLVSQLPTPRAWQVLEEDGRRTQVWRARECPELYSQLRPSFASLPPAYQSSRHYHLGIHASHPPMALLKQLQEAAHAQGGLLSVESYTWCETPPDPQQLSQMLRTCDIFSPNEGEAASIVGPGSPEQLVERLLEAGATTVSLRMGPRGALVAHGPSGECVHVPAVPGLKVVDITGCGNASCGAFLAAWSAGKPLAEAAAWGCVAGGIMSEWQGVPDRTPAELHELACSRLQLVLEGASSSRLSSCSQAAAAVDPAGEAGSSSSTWAAAENTVSCSSRASTAQACCSRPQQLLQPCWSSSSGRSQQQWQQAPNHHRGSGAAQLGVRACSVPTQRHAVFGPQLPPRLRVSSALCRGRTYLAAADCRL